MKYHEVLDYLERISQMHVPHFTQPEIGLQRMLEFLQRLGHPQKGMRGINVVGTSGKGSVTKMLVAVLSASGFKVGSTCSPEFFDLRERILLQNKMIKPKDFAWAFNELCPVLTEMATLSKYGMPSFYEITTAMALLYFKQQKCDYVVLEACMGGAFDCTNVFSKQELVLVTSIGIDHTQYLGKTIQQIATEKLGIIKKGTKVLSLEQGTSLKQIMQKEVQAKGANLELFKKCVQKSQISFKNSQFESGGVKYKLRLVGLHQINNALLVLAAAQYLGLNKKVVQRALRKVSLPGRFQLLSHRPKVILDVAHNPQKMQALAETLASLSSKKIYLIFGQMADKEVAATLKKILPLVKKVYFTLPRTQGRKVADFQVYASIARAFKVKYSLCENPKKALMQLKKESKRDNLICVTGSFAIVAEILHPRP
ncbi:MAG: bifunctional folylpolyglutamate synthase/dihydrofolate synthase [Candidatus Gracilibacteria bacterium]|nr:bifunctional folylpolyglutamate synthase/dihydrofolate synthase [Candidatus Gracilibacteria bacterium]